MLAKEIVLKILLMCVYDIDPRFDKKECVNQMVKCAGESTYESCSEYWEPLVSREK